MLEALGRAEGWEVGAFAVGVRDRSGVLATVGDTDRSFALASVTKLLTALAVHVACEEGSVALDDEAGPPGSTLAHLLAHASGLGPADPVHPLAAPGVRRIYSNAGIEVAAAHLQARAAMDVSVYVRQAVLEPLGMASTDYAGSPAHGASASLSDLLRLGAELLEPELVDPATLLRARQVAFPGLNGVLPGFGRQEPCDWGLGPEVRGAKSPHWTGSRNSPETFGHFGQSGSFLWVDPVAGLACAAVCERPFGPWAAAAWPELADAVLASWQRSGAAASADAASADTAGDVVPAPEGRSHSR